MQRDRHFDRFEDHTLLKHFVLSAYLEAWASILLKFGARRIWFVDAFAGEGRDKEGQPGSPVLAAQIAEQINGHLVGGGANATRGMHVVAIEKDDVRVQKLRQHLQGWTARRPPYVHVRHGTLPGFLDKLLEYAAGDPMFFFLDPCGIDGLSAALLPKILSGARNEVLALFSDAGAQRLHAAAVSAMDPSDDPGAEIAINPSMFGAADDARRLKQARKLREQETSGRRTGFRDREILDVAYGGDYWLPLIEGTPLPDRRRRFVELYCELLLRSGARATIPFRVETSVGTHKYYLVHASKHDSAVRAMKEAMHSARRSNVQPMLDLSLLARENDVRRIADSLGTQLAGRTLRWSDGRNESVRTIAIAQTPLWLHECDALKAELLQRGWGRQEGRRQMFAFPHLTGPLNV